MILLTKIPMKVQIKPWSLWHWLCAVCWLLYLSSLVSLDLYRFTYLCQNYTSSSFDNVHHSSARNIGFIFDEHLSFSDQISSLSKSCYSLIRALRCIRPYLDQKKQPVPSPHPLSILNLTTATLYHNLPNYTDSSWFKTLLPATVFNTSKTCHITPLLAFLHWLKIKELLNRPYKLLSLTYKILTTSQATYISVRRFLSNYFDLLFLLCSYRFLYGE